MTTTLATLPRELLIELFEFLDPDRSTCLGLTCKKLYDIHTYTQERLDKNLLYERPRSFQPSSNLPTLLATWMDPDLVYGYPYTHKFATEERLAGMKKEWVPWLMAWKKWQLKGLQSRRLLFPFWNGEDAPVFFYVVRPGRMSSPMPPMPTRATPFRASMVVIREVEDAADSYYP
jgi:hypothetical protein